MSRPEPFKTPHAEREIFIGRLIVAIGFMLLLSGLLVYRYFSLQILEFEDYRVQSDRNRVHLQSISPTRGLVFDRNGVLLADNRPSYTLTVIKERVADLKPQALGNSRWWHMQTFRSAPIQLLFKQLQSGTVLLVT